MPKATKTKLLESKSPLKTLSTFLFYLFISVSISVVSAKNNKINSLDLLFDSLKNVTSEQDARKIENEIWKTWLRSGDEKIDELMKEALRKRRSYNLNGALNILNQVIKVKPDYPEAWNQRATVFFHQGKYKKSLKEIAKTLELEPRHFGSLAGRAMIRLKQLKPVLARQNIKEALKYHPYLKEKALFPSL